MTENSKDYTPGVYQVFRSAQGLPLVFDSPHSGRIYPEDFRPACPLPLLKKAEDNYLDEIFQSVPARGGTLLCALFARTYIDANRAETDIDPALLAEPWPGPVSPTRRSRAGNGLIRRLLKPGLPVYDRTLTAAEIQNRISRYYRPYHDVLADILNNAQNNFGQVWHINCHSMPTLPGAGQPEFVLGDRDGTSCARSFTDLIAGFLRGRGYRVDLNHPYKGAEIVYRHGQPSQGRHSLQLEISKSLYWDENEDKKLKNFNELKRDIELLVSFCAEWVGGQLARDLAAD